MKPQKLPKYQPLSLDEMRVGGTDRLTIENNVNGKCYAVFRCYDGVSKVECSGVKGTCDKVVTSDFVVGVSCNGNIKMSDPAFPNTPVDTEYAQTIACINRNHDDRCFWKEKGKEYCGICKQNPMTTDHKLWCSSTEYGTKSQEDLDD